MARCVVCPWAAHGLCAFEVSLPRVVREVHDVILRVLAILGEGQPQLLRLAHPVRREELGDGQLQLRLCTAGAAVGFGLGMVAYLA